MNWKQVAVAGMLGLGGGLLVGRSRGSTPAVSTPKSAPAESHRIAVKSGPDDAAFCASLGESAPASFPYWAFPGPGCEAPTSPDAAPAQPAAANDDLGPSSPVCSSELHENFFVVHGEDGRLARFAKALNPFAFGCYRGQVPSPMGDHSIINGVPMRVAQMHIAESPNTLLDYYAEQFAMNDIHAAPRMLQGESGPLSLTFQLGDDDQNVLVLVPMADGTMVLAAVGERLKKFPAQAQIPESFPHPAEVENVTVDAVSEGTSLQRDMMFTAALDLDHVRAFYQEALARKGFQPEPVKVDKPQRWQQGFFRKDEVINLSAETTSSGRSTVNVIWVTHPLAGDEP